jgi:cytochrome c551/c552
MDFQRKALFAVIVSSGLASTAVAADGKALFLENKCNMCHSVDSQSIEKTSKTMKGVDLSNAASLVESADWAKSFLKREVKKDDKNHQREFKGTDEELNAIVDWLMTLKTP